MSIHLSVLLEILELKQINKMPCSKCATEYANTKHHVIPRCVVRSKRKNTYTVVLCRTCHDSIEDNILAVESFVGNVAYGTRYALEHKHYHSILKNFLANSKIVYVEMQKD